MSDNRVMKKIRWRPGVSALDYGADPAGRADATAAIRAALTQAEQNYGWLPGWAGRLPGLRRLVSARRTVFLPAGTYLVVNDPPGEAPLGPPGQPRAVA
jgi:Pectate lyase superfamily protein